MIRIFFTAVGFILFFGCQNNSAPVKKVQKNSIVKEKIKSDDKVYEPSAVESRPKFPNGLYAFFKKTYVVSEEIIKDEAFGRPIFASFVIEKDGSLSTIKIIRDFGYGSGKEFERVLKLCPKWTPAKIDGQPVRCSYTIPYYLPYL